MTVEQIQEVLKDTKVKTIKWDSAKKLHQHQLETLEIKLETLGKDTDNLAAAEIVLGDLITHCSAQTKSNIEAFLSLSLQQIFQNPILRIELVQELKRDRIETRVVLHEGDVSGPPSKVAGGGVQNVLGFLLRFLVLRRMQLKRLFILDEAFRNVSAGHIPTLCSFLQHLTVDHEMDILLVSHDPLFFSAADQAVILAKIDGKLIIVHSFIKGVNDAPKDISSYLRSNSITP